MPERARPWGLILTLSVASALALGTGIGFFLLSSERSTVEVQVDPPMTGPSDADLRAEVAAYLDYPKDVDVHFRDLSKTLADRGQNTAGHDLYTGFLTLAREKERRTGRRPARVNFRGSYGEPYKLFREPGISHDEAIAKLIEMWKF